MTDPGKYDRIYRDDPEEEQTFIVKKCDRCGSINRVRTFTSCDTCGPVPLCSNCRTAHLKEILADEARTSLEGYRAT